MATFVKFQPFVEAAMEKVHNLGSDQLKVALTNTAPTAGNAVLTDIIGEISYTNCSTRNIVTTSSAQTTGTYKLVLQDLQLLAGGGTVGPFRYVVLYNSTAASSNLIGYYDYGATITLNDAETFTIDFDGTNGVIQLA